LSGGLDVASANAETENGSPKREQRGLRQRRTDRHSWASARETHLRGLTMRFAGAR